MIRREISDGRHGDISPRRLRQTDLHSRQWIIYTGRRLYNYLHAARIYNAAAVDQNKDEGFTGDYINTTAGKNKGVKV